MKKFLDLGAFIFRPERHVEEELKIIVPNAENTHQK
jgi:hypothetical protein